MFLSVLNGSKKYAYTKWVKKSKIDKKEKYNILDEKDDKYLILEITVSGVPKKRSKRT